MPGTLYMQVCADTEFSITQFIDAVKKMSKDSFNQVRGSFLMVPAKERTELQASFIRAINVLQSYVPADMDSKCSALRLDLFNLPQWVHPLSALDPVALQGARRNRLIDAGPPMQTKSYTIRDIFAAPDLLNTYSVGVHGHNGTTGWGKTQTAIPLASMYAQCMKANNALPPLKRYLLVTNTADVGKSVNFEADGIAAWLLDEFEPGDTHQQQHMSSAMLKVLLSPALQGTMRCKGSETLVLPPGLPRLFTSNCPDGQSWCGTRFEWEQPMQRKHIFCIVLEPLLKADVRLSASVVDDVAGSQSVSTAAADILRHAGL